MRALLYRAAYPLAQAYWFIQRPRVTGAGIILERDGAILMLRHTYGHRDWWGLPGGQSKRDEEPGETARRELREELGVETALKPLGTAEVVEDWRRITSYCFLGQIKNETITRDPGEIAEYRWWPANALPERRYPSAKAGLKLLAESRGRADS